MSSQSTEAAPRRVCARMEGRVAVLQIDNPPVNAASHAVRNGLAQGIEFAARHGAEAAVLIGAGRSFIAGSDLREFGKPLAWP